MGCNEQSLPWRRPWLIEPTNQWMCWGRPDDVRDAVCRANIWSILAVMVD